jgi:hypothetical protein
MLAAKREIAREVIEVKRAVLAAFAILVAAGVTAVAVAVAGSGPVGPVVGTLTIRHELVGCHSWSLNGGTYVENQTVHLVPGQSLDVVNHDTCTHTLVKKQGGQLGMIGFYTEPEMTVRVPIQPDKGAVGPTWQPGEMAQWGAGTTMTFYEMDTYRVVTREGEPFVANPGTTTGPDNELTLNVVVHHGPMHPGPQLNY